MVEIVLQLVDCHHLVLSKPTLSKFCQKCLAKNNFVKFVCQNCLFTIFVNLVFNPLFNIVFRLDVDAGLDDETVSSLVVTIVSTDDVDIYVKKVYV